MDDEGDKQCRALEVRIDALEKMLNEREERTKERFAAMDKTVGAALSASDKAVSKAETATEKRFEGVNEFRQTLADQAGLLMPRAEYSVQYSGLLDRISLVERRIGSIEDKGAGKSEGLNIVGQIMLGVVAFISAVGAGLIAFFKH